MAYLDCLALVAVIGNHTARSIAFIDFHVTYDAKSDLIRIFQSTFNLRLEAVELDLDLLCLDKLDVGMEFARVLAGS